jgi:hypothetical protein
MTIQIEKWLQSDGWLSFSHQSQPDHLKPFEESWDHMGIWLTQELLNKKKTVAEIRKIIERGLANRYVEGKYLRHPTSTTPMKLDQLDFMYPLLSAVGMAGIATALVKQCNEFMLPHKRDHFNDRTTMLGRFFECADISADHIFGSSEVSVMNNIARLIWGSFNERPNKKAIKLLNKYFNPYWVVVVYGARRPEDGAGKTKEERRQIFDRVYQIAITQGPTEKDTPPIYRDYLPIVLSYLNRVIY